MGEALAKGAPGFLASDEHGHFHLRAPSHSDQSNLTTGGGDPLFPLLARSIDGAERVDLAVAFAMDSGVRLIEPWLRDLLARGGQLRLPEFAQRVVADEAPQLPPQPHHIQNAALAALRKTRADGHEAGLVVLATGLGKTWLAAFDRTPSAPAPAA